MFLKVCSTGMESGPEEKDPNKEQWAAGWQLGLVVLLCSQAELHEIRKFKFKPGFPSDYEVHLSALEVRIYFVSVCKLAL